jgi:hypothetical protein
MRQSVADKLTKVGAWLIAAMLVLLPFHAFLTVWIGSRFGIYEIARLWDDFLLVGLAGLTAALALYDRRLWSQLKKNLIVRLTAAYAALYIVGAIIAALYGHASSRAIGYSLVVNLRFLIFFIVCGVIALKAPWLARSWRKLVFIPVGLVVGFGLLQAFVLPKDILRHVGYGPGTISAYQAVDQKPDYARVQSTMRGPNPLGAYLVIIISLVLVVLMTGQTKGREGWGYVALLAGSIVVLGYTYSRSAYIGAAVAVLAILWLLARRSRLKWWLMTGVAAVVCVGGASIYLLRDNNLAQNVIFHTNELSTSPRSSNQDRLGALENGLTDVMHEPLGRGPGTAGPASVYNPKGGVRIAENYYLQIGQEVGWLGLGLFCAILAVVGKVLARKSSQPVPAGLLAGLLGISAVAMVSHAWTDDTLSLLWWGLAGLYLLPAILKELDIKRAD